MNQPLYLVVGLGKTGHSIARYLHRRQLPFVVFDTRQEVEGLDAFLQDFAGVEVFFSELPTSLYNNVTTIILSPGVDNDLPFLAEARKRDIPIIGDIECFAREVKAPVIAITGTNGKSTVTTLVGEMLKAAGLSVAVAGNIGMPVLDALDSGVQYDVWVLELSSFQLDLVYSLIPLSATILNVSPDHLDRHHSMEAYIAAKQRVYQNAKNTVINRSDKYTYCDDTTTSFGLDKGNLGHWGITHKDGKDYLACGDNLLLLVDALCIKGKHNWENALAACALVSPLGIEKTAMITALTTFKGLPHRCQWVRKLEGVDWINDSKGTNIGAAISAISGIGGSISGKIVLIAGGLGKGADFRELRSVVSQYVRAIVLIGTDADKIENALTDLVLTKKESSLNDAVQQARSLARSEDVVLLSPACASLDMFRDFNHRGEAFITMVGSL